METLTLGLMGKIEVTLMLIATNVDFICKIYWDQVICFARNVQIYGMEDYGLIVLDSLVWDIKSE